jgi:hypothetical protein
MSGSTGRVLRNVDKNILDSASIPRRCDSGQKSHGAVLNSTGASHRNPNVVNGIDDSKSKEVAAKCSKRTNHVRPKAPNEVESAKVVSWDYGPDVSSNLLNAFDNFSPKAKDLDASLLAKEEATLLERAAQLERDRQCLNERKHRAYLQKLEADLKEEAEKEMQAFQDALQNDMETQIVGMMHEKEAQLNACTKLRQKLLAQCEQIQQLLERCTVKTGTWIRFQPVLL